MLKIFKATRFGNPILRQKTKQLTKNDILSTDVQQLIKNMYYTLQQKPYGVGLAAPQVGKNIALSVIGIKPTPTRPDVVPFDTVIINPKILEMYGKRTQMWEGCVSCGTADDTLYAKVPRYKRIRLEWQDEHSVRHEEILDGFVAHVAQHEVDHLNGVLFVDLVKDSSTYMMADEYRKRIQKTK
jgi:peptide deformylase